MNCLVVYFNFLEAHLWLLGARPFLNQQLAVAQREADFTTAHNRLIDYSLGKKCVYKFIQLLAALLRYSGFFLLRSTSEVLTTVATITVINTKMAISTQLSPNIAVCVDAVVAEGIMIDEPRLIVTECELLW